MYTAESGYSVSSGKQRDLSPTQEVGEEETGTGNQTNTSPTGNVLSDNSLAQSDNRSSVSVFIIHRTPYLTGIEGYTERVIFYLHTNGTSIPWIACVNNFRFFHWYLENYVTYKYVLL